MVVFIVNDGMFSCGYRRTDRVESVCYQTLPFVLNEKNQNVESNESDEEGEKYVRPVLRCCCGGQGRGSAV